MKRTIDLPQDLELEIERLLAESSFPTFEIAVEELIRLGMASLRAGRPGAIPPGQVPSPERPNIPDPTRDILKM